MKLYYKNNIKANMPKYTTYFWTRKTFVSFGHFCNLDFPKIQSQFACASNFIYVWSTELYFLASACTQFPMYIIVSRNYVMFPGLQW